ncbi:MAG: xanthine dehydrogenase family protein molybdopterin-binding subunit [Labilithrix sp.]|nr:xanthine dehydrogenase family protein molybdopterin-binding subunit [Labilithrix sp.]
MRRREFLGGLGILSLGFEIGCGPSPIVKHARESGTFAPNAWVSIRRDGGVVVEVDKVELGQGVTTLYATLVAEELDVPIDAVETHYADSLPAYRTSSGMQLTGGSTSTRDGYLPIRKAAAAAREMLVGAAATTWGVPPAECRTEGGFVIHGGDRLAYGALTVSAASRPVPSSPNLKPRSAFRLIGKHGRRVEARAKVDGTAKFGIDVRVPNMVRAWVLHGPVFGANAISVRSDKALALPGVLDVFAFPGGVAVVAEKTWQAIAAARVIEVTWDRGVVAGLDTEKLRAAARADTSRGDEQLQTTKGNADKAIANAATKIEAFYEAPYLCHASMEPLNCTVHVRGKKVEVWAPVQSPSVVQAAVAEVVGVSPEDVLVHTTLAGGGFGRRTHADFAVQAAQIAKRVGRPVQMTWSRESDMTQAQYRSINFARMRGALRADGNVAGIDVHLLGQPLLEESIAAFGDALPFPRAFVDTIRGLMATNTLPDLGSLEGFDNTYEVEHRRIAFTPIRTKLPSYFWRAVGPSFTCFALESFIDELAHAARVDPFEFRRRLLPVGSRARRVLDMIAPAWSAPKAPGVGRGIARITYAGETEVAEVVDVELVAGRIKVRRVHVVVDCGLAVNPDIVRAQMEGAVIFGLSAALDQEITLANGVVQQRNFDTYPVLRMFECPEITVTIVDSGEAPTGVGEPGLPPIAPAVANALFALTGRRLRRLPLQKELDVS